MQETCEELEDISVRWLVFMLVMWSTMIRRESIPVSLIHAIPAIDTPLIDAFQTAQPFRSIHLLLLLIHRCLRGLIPILL